MPPNPPEHICQTTSLPLRTPHLLQLATKAWHEWPSCGHPAPLLLLSWCCQFPKLVFCPSIDNDKDMLFWLPRHSGGVSASRQRRITGGSPPYIEYLVGRQKTWRETRSRYSDTRRKPGRPLERLISRSVTPVEFKPSNPLSMSDPNSSSLLEIQHEIRIEKKCTEFGGPCRQVSLSTFLFSAWSSRGNMSTAVRSTFATS